MRFLSLLIVLLAILWTSKNQSCLSPSGSSVSWWVSLIFPNTLPSGYAYFDSTFTNSTFSIYKQNPDTLQAALGQTLQQINSLGLQTLGWNDEMPNGSTSSSKAHSKGVLAYNSAAMNGFFLCHSIPKYPAFNKLKVNISIDASEKIYAQHAFCLSTGSDVLADLITKILPTRPNLYANNLNNPNFINNLMASGQIKSPDYNSLFTYRNYTVNQTSMKFIFKNGGLNASIFEDGLNNMLKSPILAETWGRPLQDPWCGTYPVGNVANIVINAQINWQESQDHSKWACATKNNYCCFGDMNRMDSQWVRGGAFYCLQSSYLKQAITKIVTASNLC